MIGGAARGRRRLAVVLGALVLLAADAATGGSTAGAVSTKGVVTELTVRGEPSDGGIYVGCKFGLVRVNGAAPEGGPVGCRDLDSLRVWGRPGTI